MVTRLILKKSETPYVVSYSINQHQHRRILCRLHNVLKLLIRRFRHFELGVHVWH